jgi:hypothetical protein
MNAQKYYEDRLTKSEPLIILGMHRSGTSLVVRLLKDIGILMGKNLSRDAESIFFQKINRKIYNSADSDWGNIDGLLTSMKYQNFIKSQAEKVSRILFPDSSFMGINRGISNHFDPSNWPLIAQRGQLFWGWKDPRTTLTFPIWLKIFPNARILHVLRNGIDVAISTHKRSLKQQRKLWKQIIPFDFIPETLDFNYCYHLWEKYVSFVINNKNLIQPDHYREIRYEDLLSLPIEEIKNLTSFIGYPAQDKSIENACLQINRDRRDNSHNKRLYQKEIQQLSSHDLLNKLGYSYPEYTVAEEVRLDR